jgi:hypothetical protein
MTKKVNNITIGIYAFLYSLKKYLLLYSIGYELLLFDPFV